MKKVIYKSVYKLLSALSGKINNRYINRYKIAVGTSLLLLTSGCQIPKKNNKSENSKDTIYSDSIQPQKTIDDNILCYEMPATVEDTIEVETPPPPTIPVTVDVPEITCYDYVEDTISVNTNEVYTVVEQMPEFPGGSQALLDFIKKNVYYPKEYGDISIQGRVIVQFVIEKDGSVSNPVIIRSIDRKLDAIALEVINKLPNFTPGKQRGKTVRVRYTVPVSFRY